MSLTARTLLKARTATTTVQRRTFIDWMTNYPDKLSTDVRKKGINHQKGRQAALSIHHFFSYFTYRLTNWNKRIKPVDAPCLRGWSNPTMCTWTWWVPDSWRWAWRSVPLDITDWPRARARWNNYYNYSYNKASSQTRKKERMEDPRRKKITHAGR